LIAKIAILFYFPKLLREKVAIRKWENDVLGVYFTQRVQILYFIKKWAKKAQGGLSVADGCRCLTKELDMIAC